MSFYRFLKNVLTGSPNGNSETSGSTRSSRWRIVFLLLALVTIFLIATVIKKSKVQNTMDAPSVGLSGSSRGEIGRWCNPNPSKLKKSLFLLDYYWWPNRFARKNQEKRDFASMTRQIEILLPPRSELSKAKEPNSQQYTQYYTSWWKIKHHWPYRPTFLGPKSTDRDDMPWSITWWQPPLETISTMLPRITMLQQKETSRSSVEPLRIFNGYRSASLRNEWECKW